MSGFVRGLLVVHLLTLLLSVPQLLTWEEGVDVLASTEESESVEPDGDGIHGEDETGDDPWIEVEVAMTQEEGDF